MGKRQSMGAVFRRENKKKRYTQKLSKKTINEVKNRGKSNSKPRTSFPTAGSRVGTTVHNESRDRVKAVLKKALTSNKPVSKAHLNQSLGGRAGSQTQRIKLKSYDTYKSNKGLSASESARKSEFKRATSYQGMRLGETRKDLASGFYSNKKSEAERTKEKANVRKNIEKGYNKKAENSTASFLAGLTKSNKTIETASKALLDKKVDTSKVTKKGAYKAGDTVQELASYFIAPTEAAAGKIGAKMVERGASKVLQNSVKNLSRKEAKAMLKKAAGGEIKNIGGKGIAKAATKKANERAINAATKKIKDDAVKKAVREAGKEVVGSRVKRQIARRGGDVAANAAFNAKYAVDRATDSKGKTNWKEAAKDFALNTGFDVGIGGGIDSITGKVRKVKATKAENIAQAEAKIKEGITKKSKARAERAEARALKKEAQELTELRNTIIEKTGNGRASNVQKKKSVKSEIPVRRHDQKVIHHVTETKKTAVRGKKGVRSASQYDAGEVVKGLSDRINKLEAEGKINKKTAKDRRKALAKAYENVTGRTGVVERSGQFSSISKKGLNEISDGTVNGRSLTFDRRFKGAVERIGKKAEEAPATKKLADKTYTAKVKKLAKAEQALDEQIANATGEQKSILQKFKDKVDSRRKADAPESVSKDYESVENAEVKETINNAENELKSSDISKEREALLKQRNDIEQRVKEGKLDPEDAADDIGDIDERLDELEEAETVANDSAREYNGLKGENNEERIRTGESDIRGTSEGVSARQTADRTGVEGRADAGKHETASGTRRDVRLSDKQKARMTEGGITDTHASSADHAAFSDAINKEKGTNPHGGYVDPKSVDELKESGAKTFLTDDSKAGIAVTKDGDIEALFKGKDSKHKGVVNDLVITARANGGAKMDCFGKALVNKYERCGFVPVARVKFNPEYVSDPVLLKNKPDVYVLMKNTDDLDTVIEKNINGEYKLSTRADLDKLPEMEYDDALNYRDELLKKQEDLKSTPTTVKKNVSEASTGKTEYREAVKEQDNIHKRKEDDTITEKNSPSMAEVDNVREMNEPRTTHDDNLTKAGRERHEKLREKKAYEEELDKANEEKPSKSDGEKTKVADTDDIVGTEPKKNIKAEINKGTTKFRRAFVNSMDFTERQAKKFAKDNGDPEFAKRVSANVNNLRQASQQAAHSLEVEQLDIHGNKVGKSGYEICKDMQKRGTGNDVYEYLLNMHHADRVDNAAEKIVLGSDADKRIFPERTPEEARNKAKEIYDKYVEAGRKDEFMRDVQDVVRYFRNDLRSQMLSGVISEDTFRHYIDTYPNYIPTHRVGTGTATRPKVNAKSAVEYAAKGSDRKVLPLQNQMEISTTNTFTRSAMNDVAKDIADMHNVPSEAYNALTEKEIQPIDTMTFFDVPDGKLRWTEDGEWKEITVDKNFLKDLEDSQKNYFSDSLVMKALTKGNAVFKALITSYSPTFMIRNFLRDVPEGWFQSQNTLLNMQNMPSGFKSILTNDDWYRAYVRQGGSHAQFINPEKIFNKEWKLLKPLEKLERLNEITEQIPRMAEFRGYLKKLGVTPQTATVQQLRQASLAAADVTVNFGRSGSIGRFINKGLVPFFNPAIQGTSKFARVLTQDKSVKGYFKLLGKAAALGIAPAMLNDMVLADNKNYQKISDRDRAINYYVPLDADNPLAKLFGSKEVGAKDGEIFLKIPKARIMSVFGAGTQKIMGNLPDTDMLDLVAIAKDQIGPVGIENNIFHQFVNAKNNKTWYDTPIETAGDQFEYKDGVRVNKPMRKRYDANTSSISIKFADALHKATGIDVSPKRLDYLIDSYAGVAGDIALGRSKKAAQRGYWAKAFSTDTTTQSNIQQKYYDKLTSEKTSSKDRKKMSEWSDRISLVKKAIDNVQNSKSKNKAKEVRELTKLRNSLMEKAVNGKKSKDPTSDIKSIADTLGAKKTFDMVANKSDKKVLKKYGKADDKFLNSYVAVKSLTAGQKGKPSKAAQAVAIVSAGGGKKVAKAFGVTQKSDSDMASAYKRAKDYFKNGGSVEEFKRFQKASKNVKGKGKDTYLNKAYALAKMGASDRAFAVFDIKDTKVTKARNMAAVGVTPKQIQAHRGKADTSGNNYLDKAEVQAYVSRLKGSKAKKSVIYDSLAFWRNNGNPYGSINATAKQAADKKFKAKYSGGKSDEGKAGPVPLKRGYQTENGKKKPNGKTIGSIGEKVALPTRSYKDWKKDAKTRTLPPMNAFGSRINDKTKTVQREKDKPLVIHKVTKNKDGSTDIKFANGEVWHNPEKKEKKDNTKLGTSAGGGGGGRRGYRRGYRRYGRGGYGGRGGSGGGASTPSTPKLNLSPYATKSVPHRTIGIGKRSKSKAKEGLTKAQLKEIMKMAVKSDNKAKKTKTSSANPYKITKS